MVAVADADADADAAAAVADAFAEYFRSDAKLFLIF
jgi:hypothetical protein